MQISSLPRIYINQVLETQKPITLLHDEMHYIKNVLRAKIGQKFRIFNNNSGEFIAQITGISNKAIELVIEDLLRKPEKSEQLICAPAIIKNDKMSDLISMIVQVGVTQIIPIITQYTSHKISNLERFQRIVIESVEQSERLDIPEISPPTKLSELLKSAAFDKILYACERSNIKNNIQEIGNIIAENNTLLIIGPEGGFSAEELQEFDKYNAIGINLGKNILRSETAAVKLISYIQFIREYHNA